MNAEEYRKKIELDILKIIEEKLTNGQMDIDRAKAIARMVLDKLHPPLTLEQIYKIAPTLDDEFQELTAAIAPVLKDHEEEITKIVTEHAQMLIKSGKINEATKILKEAKQLGFSDARIGKLTGQSETQIRALRHKYNIRPAFFRAAV